MKYFYKTLIIITTLLMATYFVVTIAIPKEYFLAMTLEMNQEKWDLSIHDDWAKSLNNHEPKKELIQFINKNKNNYTGAKEVFIISITVLILSLIGYLREKYIKKINP